MERYLNKVKERIKQHIELQGISKRKFYSITGIANGTLDQKTGLSEENMYKYLSAYSNINPEWLITGEGEMYKSQQLKAAISEFENNPRPETSQEAMRLIIKLKSHDLTEEEKAHMLDDLLILVAKLGDKISELMADMLLMYKND